MNEWDWWQRFTRSGKVEDYLRYRNVVMAPDATNGVGEEEQDDGKRPKTASDDRRPDSAPL